MCWTPLPLSRPGSSPSNLPNFLSCFLPKNSLKLASGWDTDSSLASFKSSLIESKPVWVARVLLYIVVSSLSVCLCSTIHCDNSRVNLFFEICNCELNMRNASSLCMRSCLTCELSCAFCIRRALAKRGLLSNCNYFCCWELQFDAIVLLS